MMDSWINLSLRELFEYLLFLWWVYEFANPLKSKMSFRNVFYNIVICIFIPNMGEIWPEFDPDKANVVCTSVLLGLFMW